MAVIRLLLACLLTFSTAQAGPLTGQRDGEFLPVDQAFPVETAIQSGRVSVHWSITPGHYLYEKQFRLGWDQPAGLPTQLMPDIRGERSVHDDPTFGRVTILRGDVDLQLSPPAGLPADGQAELLVRYQGCADAGLCYPPQTLRVPVNFRDWQGVEASAFAAPDAEDADALARWLRSASLPVVMLTFLVLGIGLAFTPCVLPMVPILSAIVVGDRQANAGSGLRLAIAYVLGMSLVYTLAGLLIAGLGAAANVSAWMQQPAVLMPLALLFTGLAFILASGRDLRLPALLREPLERWQARQQGGRWLPVFVMGAVSSLVVSPCVSAPLAGILIFLAGSQDMVLGAAALFSLSLGMGLPLLLVGAGGGRWLPRSGAWLDDIKRLFAWLLLLVAVSLLVRLLTPSQALLGWAVFAALTAMALLRDPRRSALLAGGLMLIVAGLELTAWARGGDDPLRPWQALVATAPSADAHAAWQDFTDPAKLDAAIEAARAAGKPVIVDVYADWCVSCVNMAREVLPRSEVVQALSPAVQLRFDITDTTAAQLAWLQRERLFGPPAFLTWNARGEKRPALVGESSQKKFMQYLEGSWN